MRGLELPPPTHPKTSFVRYSTTPMSRVKRRENQTCQCAMPNKWKEISEKDLIKCVDVCQTKTSVAAMKQTHVNTTVTTLTVATTVVVRMATF